MILKGSQRGFGQNLAAHLLNSRDNDHVSLSDVRGVAAEDLRGAFLEIEATARGTKCQQPFFHVIFNPPESAHLTREQFAEAFDKLETDMGLKKHPRAVVFHEKNGREHAHVVYSRIHESLTYDHGEKQGQERGTPVLKAKQLSHFKMDLQRISRDLHHDLGLPLPAGLKDPRDSDPLNFDRATWQQAMRIEEDPRDLKKIIGEAFEFSDSAKAFSNALEQQAMQLARGDKRGFVVVHHSGEALPLTRYLGLRQKAVTARLGQPEHVQTVDQARSLLTDRMTAEAEKKLDEQKRQHSKERRPMVDAVHQLRQEHRTEREALAGRQDDRQSAESLARAKRIRTGVMGLIDRAALKLGTGKLYRELSSEIKAGVKRDAVEFHSLKSDQLKQRQQLQKSIKLLKEKHKRERQQSRTILGHWLGLDTGTPRRRIEDHLRQQDDTKNKYMMERKERREFRDKTDRRKEQKQGRKLGLKPKGPTGPKM